MSRSISESFLRWLQTSSGSLMLKRIHQFPSLSVNLAGDSLKVYFNGMLILSVPAKIALDESIILTPLSVNYRYENDRILGDVIARGVNLASLQDYLGAAIGFLSRRDNKRQEERVRQEITYVNNRSRIANDTDYFVVAQEYPITDYRTNKKSKFDLVTIKWSSSAICRKEFSPSDIEIVVFELKYGMGAIGGSKKSKGRKADLRCHIDDFNNSIIHNDINREGFVCDIISMFVQQASLNGFYAENVNGMKHVRRLLNSDEIIRRFAAQVAVKFGFILVDYKGASSLLKEQLEMFDDDFLFATSSYMGYGLYENFMFNRTKLLEKLTCI